MNGLFQDMCSDLGISLFSEKSEGPIHHFTFWSLGEQRQTLGNQKAKFEWFEILKKGTLRNMQYNVFGRHYYIFSQNIDSR